THHPGIEDFEFAHRYAGNPPGRPQGTYTVHVAWFDQHGAGNSRDLFVTVDNAPPKLFLGGTEVVGAGEVMRHAGYFTDANSATRRATVDYGDGFGPQPLVIQPGQELSFEHRYTTPGKYRVTVTLLDDDGVLTTDSFLVIVL